MAPPCKYNTDEDRREGYLEAQRRSAAKIWNCEYCNLSISKGNKTNHLKSKKHYINNEIKRLLAEEKISNGGENDISNENEEKLKYFIIVKCSPPIVKQCDKETALFLNKHIYYKNRNDLNNYFQNIIDLKK